jgi:chemotaxis protein MotB
MARSVRWWTALVTAALLAGSLGCVTQGKYDVLAAERDQLRAKRDVLEREVATLTAAKDELSDELTASQIEMVKLRETYDGLVGELKTEVATGRIEIQQLVDGIRLNVSDELLFPSGSAELNAAGRSLLSRVAAQIKAEKSIVEIEGHTDNVGISGTLKQRYPTNWELAAWRATSVVRVLSEAGMDPTMLRAVSRGPFAPIASNDTPEGRAKNRRTEIIVRHTPR